jgi:hypothetical protein
LFLGALLVLLAGLAAQAEVKVVADRNRNADATLAFKFKSVSAPASNDAASKAKVTIVDYTETPELKDWVVRSLQPTADKWYPKIVEALPSTD